MSIRVMTAVWEESRAGGVALLCLLALADHADDEGWCYPAVVKACPPQDRPGGPMPSSHPTFQGSVVL